MVLTYDDFLAFAGLDDEAVQAVARQSHLPCSVAVALAGMIVQRDATAFRMQHLIEGQLAEARRRRDPIEASRLRLVLRDLPPPTRRAPATAVRTERRRAAA